MVAQNAPLNVVVPCGNVPTPLCVASVWNWPGGIWRRCTCRLAVYTSVTVQPARLLTTAAVHPTPPTARHVLVTLLKLNVQTVQPGASGLTPAAAPAATPEPNSSTIAPATTQEPNNSITASGTRAAGLASPHRLLDRGRCRHFINAFSL